MSQTLDAVHALYAALELGQPRPELFTEDARTLEHPNAIKPRGAQASLAEMMAAAQKGKELLSSQRYEVRSAIEHGDTAIVRLRWTGVIAKDAGPFRQGQVLTAHIAQFIETRGWKVASIETYDCYEPFG